MLDTLQTMHHVLSGTFVIVRLDDSFNWMTHSTV